MTRSDFFCPRAQYRGQLTPEKLAFNVNLQAFAQRVSLIVGLETGGKLSPSEAFTQIEQLWEQLARSKESLQL